LARLELLEPRRLTAGGTDHDHPVFTPDARHIVCAAGAFGNQDIYLLDRRGRFVRRLTNDPGNETPASFSPDGTRLAYCAQAGPAPDEETRARKAAPWEIRVLDLAGERSVVLLGDGKSSYKQPDFSPDGRRVAYFSNEASPETFHLHVLDLETGGRRQLTSEPNRNDCHPAWAPDGRRIAFHAYEGLESDRANIYVLDAADGSVVRATDRPGLSKHPCFVDDRTIVFHREEPGEWPALFAVDVEKGRETRLTPPGVCAKQPNAVRTRKGELRLVWTARREPRDGAPVFDLYVATLSGIA
jgi:dipeptidyl aminopeptidase/acylaminoacyl peptidase